MDWNPSAESTEVEAPVDRAHAVPGSVLVEHFEVPYVADLADGHPGTLFEAARVYLATAMNLPHVRGTFDLPDGWQRWLETASASDTAFGWLPFETKDRRYPNAPHGSFLLEGGRLAVLFASQRLNTDAYLGSGFGFAVPVHLHKDSKGARAWFHGFSASLPHGSFF